MANGKHARLGTVTNMLHNLKRKFNKAESIGFRKGLSEGGERMKQEYNEMSFIKRLALAFQLYRS